MNKCKNCDKDINNDEEFCSKECEEEYMNDFASMVILQPDIPPDPQDFT